MGGGLCGVFLRSGILDYKKLVVWRGKNPKFPIPHGTVHSENGKMFLSRCVVCVLSYWSRVEWWWWWWVRKLVI